MDFSKLSIGIYELIGLIFPGYLAICEGWVTVRGWDRFISTAWNMNWTVLLFLAVASFAVGEILQEVARFAARITGGEQRSTSSRAEFWTSVEGSTVKEFITKELGTHLQTVDAGFDYCLTRIEQRFPKRETFLATSDFAGALLVVAMLGLFPLARFTWMQAGTWHRLIVGSGGLFVVAIIALTAWVRMLRFRVLADITVFRVYLATCGK